MKLLPASEEVLSKFPSSRYLSSSGSYLLDLSGVGNPAGSNATGGLALRVTGIHKPLHHDNVEIPLGGAYFMEPKIQYRVHKSLPLNSSKSRMKLIVFLYLSTHFNIILDS
jgi:hypothetical protein